MRVPWEVLPEPSSTRSIDPFNPDPTIFPPAPDWLFPLVMTLLGIAFVIVAVLIFMWRKSITMENRRRAEAPATEWVDLSKLEKGGRWREEGEDQPTDEVPPAEPRQ